MQLLLLPMIWILSAYKWSDWRNWKKYYPTILFFILSDLIYNFIAYNYPLWELTSPKLGVTYSVLIKCFTSWPASTLLYLTHFPLAGKLKKALYPAFPRLCNEETLIKPANIRVLAIIYFL